MNFLGYKSEVSALNWCRKNNIPIEQFGKRKYADRIAFNSLVAKSMGIDNHTDFTKGHRATYDLKSPGPGSTDSKPHSEAAEKFLSKFKSEGNEKGTDNI